MSSYDISFRHPTTIQVSGPTGSGKTRFVLRLLEDRLLRPSPSRIVWVYSEWQPDYEKVKALFPETEFVRGYSEELYDTFDPGENNLLVIDDQMSEASDSKSLAKLFTKGSHHRNLTVIYLVQNMFDQGKSSRTVSLNSHYNVVFRNLRDQTQFRTMASQMMPRNTEWLMDAFNDATSEPYGYMVIDNHPRAVPRLRFRTHIFAGEHPTFYSDRKSGGVVYKRERSPSSDDDEIMIYPWGNPKRSRSGKL